MLAAWRLRGLKLLVHPPEMVAKHPGQVVWEVSAINDATHMPVDGVGKFSQARVEYVAEVAASLLAHSTIAAATTQLTAEANEARQRIERDSTELAHAIADRVLGRQTT